ncbi:MAG: SufS family cysteine desulfurase [Gemmatimonadota bacterium]|nr:SufS family cysteine desulfurase [Gemmatimonadota bacterium]
MTHRADFPLLAANPGLHYLDSAASAQKPRVVLDAVRDYYETSYANPHRGAYSLSVHATERYHLARARIAGFLGAADTDTLIFARGTTEALNLLASGITRSYVRTGDEIIVTALEHHSNFVTWQQSAIQAGARFRICELTAEGHIDLGMLGAMLGPRTRVVAFGHVSNAIGTVNPIGEIVRLVRERSDATIVCDGAQGAPHIRVKFDEMGVDAYAFSGHKMGGPMGIGGLVARRELLERIPPYQFGGDMIEFVHDDTSTWAPAPNKFEAGTPNSAGAVGLAAAVGYLEAIGMDRVQAHEQRLVALAQSSLLELDGVTVYGPPPAERSGVLSFNVADVHPHDLATILDSTGVCIRSGHHCAQPLMRRLGVSATARASFYVYNDEGDIDALVAGVKQATSLFTESNA